MTIRSLRHQTDPAIAFLRLAPRGITGIIQRRWTGPLRGVSEVFVPYRLYAVTFADRGLQRVHYYAMDAASGTLDPYEFDAVPESSAWIEFESRNCFPVRIEETETRRLATEKVRRRLFSRGFFRVAYPRLTAELVQPEFYLPYWVGFYGDDGNLTLKVMNGVRQTMEGAKICHLLRAWLAEAPAEASLSLAADKR
jgi:hypothetical protein